MSTRRLKSLAGIVLLWFLSFIAAGTVSALVYTPAQQTICSMTGAEVKRTGGDGAAHVGSHGLDCPLCTGIGLLPPLQISAFKAVAPQAYIPTHHSVVMIATALAAPPPGRGPPMTV